MKLLIQYLRQYWKLIALALFLATINQVFSLLDPQVFRMIVDRYATKMDAMPAATFVKGVLLLLLALGWAAAARARGSCASRSWNSSFSRARFSGSRPALRRSTSRTRSGGPKYCASATS